MLRRGGQVVLPMERCGFQRARRRHKDAQACRRRSRALRKRSVVFWIRLMVVVSGNTNSRVSTWAVRLGSCAMRWMRVPATCKCYSPCWVAACWLRA